MTVTEALRYAEDELTGVVESPRVDSELLLQHLLGCTRAELWTRPLSVDLSGYQTLVARRRSGEPLQYLTGRAAFMGLDLAVGPGTLVPRPETEVLTGRALEMIADREAAVVVDVGTGSGAIALAISKSRPDAEVWALDASDEALGWARRNAATCRLARVTIMKSDLLASLPPRLNKSVDLIVTNPPYLSTAELLEAPVDVRHEPLAATVSGPSGDEVSRRIIDESGSFLAKDGWLVMETSPRLAPALAEAMHSGYDRVAIRNDLSGRARIIEGVRR